RWDRGGPPPARPARTRERNGMSEQAVPGAPTGPQSDAAAAVDIRRILDEGDWRGYQRFVVLLVALTIIFDGADNQLLSVAIPTLMEEWSLARGAFAPILALGLGGMAIGGAMAGLIGDRFGRRVALIGSVLTFGAMTGAMVFADSLFMLGTF